ncbi:MAG: PTS galactitol transporter subunit IIB [Chloroflexi bacterium]|nr:PTS galactitol transporter subunit IIB [Chloroflexota bacterium]
MGIKKKILVACGTAIATSTVVAIAIEEGLRARGVEVTTRQCKASEVPGLAADYDLIVTTTPVPANLGKPVIQTLAFLTGMGKEEVLNQIQQALSA